MKIFLAGVLLCFSTFTYAATIARAEVQGNIITLTDEPCAVSAVANLPFRATWWEAGKTFEGCYGYSSSDGLILAYFDDKTVVALPVQIFTPSHVKGVAI